ncbi:DUF3482 domain-containing protein [Salinisphaera sp.]|uniref:DUF3482 domain-containing protein n=1 Tax=Salinisphaera sp. TaxID=1914330 RepID=UPI000C46C326|nr:DUF3482 domain-containing protein [Salinisphaera sp.]MBS63446.1 GTP-binding protein [Salinisphaera sp.]
MALRTTQPAEWVTTEVPCFAVVGKVNMGKSAVLATLLEEDDDRIIRISPEPGETTRCQRLSLVLDGAERLRFIDTPGFQQPIEALRAIRALHGSQTGTPGLATLQSFVDEYRDTGEFEDECRLLEPLLQGAGILYVIDPGVPVYDSFLAEIEILRFSGRARLALLNQRGEAGAGHEHEWREHLGKAFNLVRVFDAHRARFATRRDLLAALNQIDERDREHLQTTTALLDAEWQQRREEAAERIQHFLRIALELREHGHYAEDAPAPEAAKREAVKQASRRYYERIAALERETANDLLTLYRHTAIQAEAMKGFDDDLDLASDETWRRLGLTRQQLTFVGAAVGAGAGIGVDAATFGHSLGVGALIGGLGGGALAFFKGDAIPTLRLDMARIGPLGGQRITVGPPRNPNFAWVLLDSILIRYRQILSRAHARRGDAMLEGASGDGSIARELESGPQKALARWFRSVTRAQHDPDQESAAFAALLTVLASIEDEL